MKRVGLIFTLVFGLIGLGMLVGAWFALSRQLDFRSTSETATGTVVDLVATRNSDGDTLYKPVVEWIDATGRTHTFTTSMASSPPSYDRGEQVVVRYDPARPESVQIDSFMENWMVSLILGAIGAIFTAIGVGFGIHLWRRKKQIEWLQVRGTRVQAQFTGVERDTSIKVNGRSPWVVTAQWQDPSTNVIHTFRSDSIWFDPTAHIQRETLDVLIDPNRPSVHLLDISFLPKHAG